MLSCSGEIYEDQIIVKEDGIAYNKETDKVFSGDVLDKYGELVGVYKKGLKDGNWFEVDIKKGTQKKSQLHQGCSGRRTGYILVSGASRKKQKTRIY